MPFTPMIFPFFSQGAPKEEDVDARYVLDFTEQFVPYLPQKVKSVLSCRSTIPKVFMTYYLCIVIPRNRHESTLKIH